MAMRMESDFTAIRAALQRLQRAAVPPKVFGSESHGFQTHPPLSEQDVAAFEARHGINLPADYRGFLIHVGNGGAGPAYGLFKLGEMDNGHEHERWTENDGFVGALSLPFPHTGPWNDLSEKPAYDESREEDPVWEDDFYRQLEDWEKRVYWNPAMVNGAIPICHLGCALRQWLVVTGPEAGNVWDDDRVDEGGLKPARQEGRERVTFMQWYGAWLDDALGQQP